MFLNVLIFLHLVVTYKKASVPIHLNNNKEPGVMANNNVSTTSMEARKREEGKKQQP